MFIDKAKIYVKAGNGGDGAVSFYREKYMPAGGPDGGDGGHGGDVVFVVDHGMNTLSDFRYKRKYIAQRGENGRAKRCSGHKGENCEVRVPKGTLVFDENTGRLMADLSSVERAVIARGGRGGWGNQHFATPTRQAPRFAKPGIPGEEFNLRLELKLLADVGLIGYPNVGKSSLISVVSEAKPEIANYHFTTRLPVLGVVRVAQGASFVMADIPGVIEGAGTGVGLGFEFLRHVERCRMLVHVVDISGSEGRDPITDFDTINRELAIFNPALAELPMVVAGNKADLATDEQLESFRAEMEKRGLPYFEMMAAIAQGTDELVKYLAGKLPELPPIKEYEPEPLTMAELDEAADHTVKVDVQDGVYFVEADWLLNTMRTIDLQDYEGLQYFQRLLQRAGIIDALIAAGIQEGDTVSMYDFEFDFFY
ncbi:MAG: GTPase ObgE [Clostridia bacterium]|nr:GTPase ObgE [Clostridia bacterium]